MKYYTILITSLILLLCSSGIGAAHGISIVTYTDADSIIIECASEQGQALGHGKITITDSVTKEILLEDTTDKQGMFHFHPDLNFLQKKHGLMIRLDAGAGHQKTVQVTSEEMQGIRASTVTNNQTSPEQITDRDKQQKRQTTNLEAQEINALHLSPEKLEAIVAKAINSELTPIKQTLARQENRGSELRDIIGGIGWILGLLGLATYFKYRR